MRLAMNRAPESPRRAERQAHVADPVVQMHADDGAIVEISQPRLQRVEFVANQVMGCDERVRRCSLNQQIQREPFVDVRQQFGGLGEFGPACGRRSTSHVSTMPLAAAPGDRRAKGD